MVGDCVPWQCVKSIAKVTKRGRIAALMCVCVGVPNASFGFDEVSFLISCLEINWMVDNFLSSESLGTPVFFCLLSHI